MKLLDAARTRVSTWGYGSISVMAALAAFSCYTSMYAFRKAFAAGIFEGEQIFGIDYKVCLVITQMVGYMLSKFYGIKFISESSTKKRGVYLVRLIGISWLGLLGFALTPAPYNIFFLMINGFPLGMIWGLVFSYLEGRKATEFMGAVMSVSLIFASGFVKTVGRTLMDTFSISEYWMPFTTGLVFIIPFLISVWCLELIPPPSQADQELRTKRAPMNAMQRKRFFFSFLPGIVVTIIIYVTLTVLRDIRDNFEVEIWKALNVHDNHIYATIDLIVSILVLVLMSLLILIKDNLKAFKVIHLMIFMGCVIAGASTYLFDQHYINGISWMCLVGLGLYMAYIPYNAIFFERMIANFHFKSNIGFLIYLSDSIGYLGSVSMLIYKELNPVEVSWGSYFRQAVYIVSATGMVCILISLLYFINKTITIKNKNTAGPVKTSQEGLLPCNLRTAEY